MLFADDLQWAGPTSAGIIDLVLREPMEGRAGGCASQRREPSGPLALSLARWRDLPNLTHLQLTNLPSPSLVALVAEILRVDEAAAGGLAAIIEPHTGATRTRRPNCSTGSVKRAS
jgi:predicted ATPase